MGDEIKRSLLVKETGVGEEETRIIDGDEELSLKRRVWIETKKMWVVAGPAIFTRVATFGTNVISQAFIGHIGSVQLAAFSLVFTVLVRFANGILLGMASALETLCGQSYGAKQYNMLGIHLQRSWIVLFVSTCLLIPLCVFTTPIFEALGQAENISEIAGYISLWVIPVLFAFVVSFTCQMYLQAQSKNMIVAYVSAISIGIHIFLCWLLSVKFKFGVPGVMVSTLIAYWLPNLGQLLFVLCGGCPETWTGFSILELWYNTILVLLTGNMENAEVSIDALSICLNIVGWEMMISLGFLAAASVRVSNELGRGSSRAAKFSIVVIVSISVGIGLVLFVLFLFLREQLAYIFTNDEAVAKMVAELSPLLAFSILLNSVQPVLSGVALGAGWQKYVAYVNLACYYIVGIPVGVVLGYPLKMQVEGVWIGMLFGTLVQTIVLIILTYKTDWDKQLLHSQKWLTKAGGGRENRPTSDLVAWRTG
ncbi:protein TRANSPARENT TESTA 12-like [Pyrus ussuriensis x Pyrus communis]|uniref:Protein DETOXIFICATION n=1 Tax=Pyrus ussuriensis x Pyrus communis TaxID=2448454 RepID=A0A5N5HXR2_9ROSA|nr:protein TRANSPARENT TESTA 12-like [Pyrus ussuriensis x Pyrus communis]